MKLWHFLLKIGMCSLSTVLAFHSASAMTKADQARIFFKSTGQEPKQNDIWITVWIHGTQICLGSPATKGLRSYLQQAAHTYFYCLEGLHSLKAQPGTNRHQRFAEILEQEDPTRFQADHFYTFGWSGNLSFQEREEAGAKLYHQLLELIVLYEQLYGKEPHVRIISHSHGGNVALTLAAEENKEHKHLVINELILLGCPIQQATIEYAQSPIFKTIYSLCSNYDVIQVVDPQGLYRHTAQKTPLFSQRRFPASYPHIFQADVSSYGIPHVGFLSERFIHDLPKILTGLGGTQKGQPSQEEEQLIPAVEGVD